MRDEGPTRALEVGHFASSQFPVPSFQFPVSSYPFLFHIP